MNDSDQRVDSGMGDSTAMTIEFLRARLLSERSVSKTARQRADELAKRVFELEEQLRTVSLQRMKAEKATEAVLAILEGNGISDVSETYDSSSDQDLPYESRKNESGGFSDSPVSGRLSWKGCKETSRSLERYKQSSFRRRSNFAAGSSSSKSQPGKSCRKIRYKESRSVAEDFKATPVKVDSLEEEIVPNLENSPDFCGEPGRWGSNVGKGEKAVSRNNKNEKSNGYGGDREMEEALENQAQLICQYEEMEKAQREWEEKFRENNNITPDSCDPGNRSDVTEETYEIKASAERPAVIRETDARSKVADVSKNPYNDAVGSEGEGSSMPVSGSSNQDFAFPMANAMQKEQANPNKYQSSHNSLVSGIVPSFPSNPNGISEKEQTLINYSENTAMVPQRGSEGLGGVLDALKDAKRSLQQRIDKLPIGPLDRARIPRDEFQMPVGCVGLFQLPTDYSSAGHVPNSTAQLCLDKYDLDAVRRLDSRPYIENGSMQDPFQRNGASNFSYPNYPINRTYPDLMPRMEALSSISKMDDKIRANMYG